MSTRDKTLDPIGQMYTEAQAQYWPEQFGRKPDFVIGPPDDPYLLRWWVIPRNSHANHYRHIILKSDDDRALHDHPWRSVSIVQAGKLREIYPGGVTRILEIGVPYFRNADQLHRLEVVEGPVITDFYTGHRERDWGFQCPEDSPAGGWRHWKDFVAKNPGEVGRGCGEI